MIDEIAMGPFGSNIKVDCFVPSGIPVLNGSNLTGFILGEESFHYVTPEKAASLKKAVASRGDVVITHRGTLGQIVYIPTDSKYEKYVISQSQFRVKCRETVMLPEFMVYYFHSREGQHKLLSNSSQVGVPALARPSSTFQELEMPVPAITEQHIIVDTLSALDYRIMANRKINHHLASYRLTMDSLPDIRRGKIAFRSFSRYRFSSLFSRIWVNSGSIRELYSCISPLDGMTTPSALRFA